MDIENRQQEMMFLGMNAPVDTGNCKLWINPQAESYDISLAWLAPVLYFALAYTATKALDAIWECSFK
jgi:hypothetical protein